VLVFSRAGWGFALDQEMCIEILSQSGFLPTGPVGLVNLLDLPENLSAEELLTFLRERGGETTSLHVWHELGPQQGRNCLPLPPPSSGRRAHRNGHGLARATFRNISHRVCDYGNRGA
jgi:hypothetical protein